MLELFVADELPRWSADQALRLLRDEPWAPAEQLAIEACLVAWWVERMSRPFVAPYGAAPAAVRLLCEATRELWPYGRAWVELPGEAPVRHLAAYLWVRSREADWLPLDSVAARLAQAFFEASSAPVELELSRALEVLSVGKAANVA